VYGNPVEIQQSLINLCLNSKDAMPDGGELKIRVRRFQKKGEKNKKYLCLSIEDTGEGIPDDIKEKIFEPFFSTKDRITSSGLGLYMVQRIISEHGGWIEVKDNEPKGAIFELYLPAIEKELQDVKEEKEVEWIDGQQKLVLIIDDEESIVLLIRQFLERMNFRTLVAHNGMEAIDVFNQHEDDIDLILLDYMMPLMNGKEVYLKIREKNQNIPIMLFTGVDDEEMISEFVQMGVSSVIKKPFSAFDIIRKIKQVIEWKD
jgi:CheY-like chemotaxis protein